MKKFTLIILSIVIYAFTGSSDSIELRQVRLTGKTYHLHSGTQEDYSLLDHGFTGFAEAIGFKESRSNYYCVNDRGYLGKYQFGASTLDLLGIHNAEYFLHHPALQEKAFYQYCRYNKYLLSEQIKKYSGKKIKGIEITESGIIAAAHLAGAGSVKRFLRYAGKNKTIVDAYGTTVELYLKKFAGYDLSSLSPAKYPRVR